jgi:hypothetical protein
MIYCALKNYFIKISSFIESQVQYEYRQAQKDMAKMPNLSQPYMRSKNPEFFFLLEIIIILFLAFSLYNWFSFYSYIANYSPNFIENQWNIADIPYDELQKIEIVRESWLQWYTYYYRNGIQTAEEQAYFYMNLGNLTRPLIIDTITYVILPMSIGYVVWFCIKYYDYVLAATWGWFIMMYSFMTKKVECTLAKKWYIQFVTGWKKCSPSFSKYMTDWYVRFIQRPLRQEQLNYMRAYDEFQIFQRKNSLSVLWDGFKNAFANMLALIKKSFRQLYDMIHKFFTSLGKLLLTIYQFVLSIFGVAYKSESSTGEDCKCENPPVDPIESIKTSIMGTPTHKHPPPQSAAGADSGVSQPQTPPAPKCKDSLFIDIFIVCIVLYPFRNYVPWEKISQFTQTIIDAISGGLNLSITTTKIIFYTALAVLLYAIDVYLYF